jgi:hypothetical protein
MTSINQQVTTTTYYNNSTLKSCIISSHLEAIGHNIYGRCVLREGQKTKMKEREKGRVLLQEGVDK